MRVWDAIVVGAGPAGCACAYDLAAAGKSVLLLDKAAFPRMKACAGGLTMKTVRALRYSVKPVVRETIYDISLEGPERLTVRSRKPICVMTVRQELDAFCLDKTIEAGAGFERISGLQAIEQDADGITVSSQSETWRGRFVIGADGVHSQVRKLAGNDAWFRKGIAIEANVMRNTSDDNLVFDFSPVNSGYGWVFPKQDHVNIGLYCIGDDEKLSRSRLATYICNRYGDGAEGKECVGQYLGFGAAHFSAVEHLPIARRVFLVGDAGGFADPLTGEGIYGAVISGQTAAAAICGAPERDAWQRFMRLSSKMRENLRIAEKMAASFYAHPERGFRAMKIPLLKSAVMKSYAEGLNLAGLVKVAKPLLRHR